MPIAFDLTPGQASDSRHFPVLLDLGPEIAPRAAMGDKGYDAKANRAAARSRGACPVIPLRKTAKDKTTFFPKALYRGRARIEQAVGKLKRFKRVALRCGKKQSNQLRESIRKHRILPLACLSRTVERSKTRKSFKTSC